MITADQLRHRRAILIRYRCSLAYHVAIAYHAGDTDTLGDLLHEWQRLTVNIEVLDNWLLELYAAPWVREVSRILNHHL